MAELQTQYSDCSEMAAYLNRKISIAQQLRAISGGEMRDRLSAGIILSKLPEEYTPLIQSILPEDFTTEFVKERLLSEAARQATMRRESALLSARPDHAYRGGYEYSRGQSSRGRGRGRASGGRPTTSYQFKGVCYKCGKSGHMGTDCSKYREHGKAVLSSSAQTSQKQSQRSESGNEQAEQQVNTESLHFERVLVTSTPDISAENLADWFVDSGATMHMTGQRDLFISIDEGAVSRSVATGNEEILKSAGIGYVYINCCVQGSSQRTKLRDVLYAPGIKVNLMSVKQITRRGFKVQFDKSKCEIRDARGDLCASATCSDTGLYRIDTCSTCALATTSKALDSYELWHRRLGHLSPGNIGRLTLPVSGVTCAIPDATSSACWPCAGGRRRRKPFPASGSSSKSKLELVHSDVCGPMREPSLGGHRYFVVFIDDFTRMTTVAFMKEKNETFEKLLNFIAYAERAADVKVKTIRTNNGTEYLNRRVSSMLARNGIRHETSVGYCPEQNGRAERAIRTLVEKARCMLTDAGLPESFRAEAVNTACKLEQL